MKKKLRLCSFLLLLFPFCLFSQITVGVSGGGGISSEYVFRASLPIEYELNPVISLQSGPGYLHIGNKELLVNLANDRQYSQATLTYIDLPLLAKAKLDLGGFKLYGLGGINLGYGIKLAANYTEGSIYYEETFDFDREKIKRFDLGFLLGMGIQKEITKGRIIFFDYRVLLGLTDIDRQTESDIFNQGQAFSLGFMIPLKDGNTKKK